MIHYAGVTAYSEVQSDPSVAVDNRGSGGTGGRRGGLAHFPGGARRDGGHTMPAAPGWPGAAGKGNTAAPPGCPCLAPTPLRRVGAPGGRPRPSGSRASSPRVTAGASPPRLGSARCGNQINERLFRAARPACERCPVRRGEGEGEGGGCGALRAASPPAEQPAGVAGAPGLITSRGSLNEGLGAAGTSCWPRATFLRTGPGAVGVGDPKDPTAGPGGSEAGLSPRVSFWGTSPGPAGGGPTVPSLPPQHQRASPPRRHPLPVPI